MVLCGVWNDFESHQGGSGVDKRQMFAASIYAVGAEVMVERGRGGEGSRRGAEYISQKRLLLT